MVISIHGVISCISHVVAKHIEGKAYNFKKPTDILRSLCITLRGNVGENQRGAPTCRRNLCSYSGYKK